MFSMYLNKTFIYLDGLSIDVASKRHSWVSNKAIINLNSVVTSPATEANVQQDFIKILLYIYFNYRS